MTQFNKGDNLSFDDVVEGDLGFCVGFVDGFLLEEANLSNASACGFQELIREATDSLRVTSGRKAGF
jgi:hypothetical protein